MVLSAFTELYSHHHNLIVEHFHHPSPRQPLIYFLSLDLTILNNSYKWNHMICSLLVDFFHLP